MEIRRGDIFYIKPECKSVPYGDTVPTSRPAIIVSNNKNNKYSDYIEIVFLTTRYKKPLPTHVTIDTNVESTALCEQVHTINVQRLDKFMMEVPSYKMKEIDQALMVSMGLDFPSGGGNSAEEVNYKDLYNTLIDKLIQSKIV